MPGVDPESDQIVSLFNPRIDAWDEHFAFVNLEIRALTPTGRATERLLRFNARERTEVRFEIAQRENLKSLE